MTPKQAVLKAAEIAENCSGAYATRNAIRAFAETLESEPEGLKVVAAFIAPDNSKWQGMSVNVTEDGSWWTYNGTAWDRDTVPLAAASSREGKS